MIKHLRHHEIDKQRWDECLTKALNYKTYGYSWHLDIVSPGWEAIIDEGYQAVMPLTIKKKFGISYLIQPILSQQLGVFQRSYNETDHLFYKFIFEKFIYLNICVSHSEKIHGFRYKSIIHNNYVLDLSQSYDEICSTYSKSNAKNIRRAMKQNVVIRHCDTFQSIDFLKDEYYKLLKIPASHFALYARLISEGAKHGKITCYGAFLDDRMIASICSLAINGIINFMMIASPEGKERKALFLLLDEFIREHAGSNYQLDFGGSDIESIAYFFQGFGPELRHYQQIRYSKFIPVRFL